MADRAPLHVATVRTLRLTAGFRYCFILLGIAFLLVRFVQYPPNIDRITVFGPYIIFISAAILNTLYLALLRFLAVRRHLYALVAVQITLDAVLISGLVFFTGGIFSAITSFYFAVLLEASIILTRRESLFFASLCTILFSAIHILYAVNFQQNLWEASWLYLEWRADYAGIISRLLFHGAAFYTVAFLSGTLANLLRTVRILNVEILQNISEGILVVDAERRITFANPALREMFGLPDAAAAAGGDSDLLFTRPELAAVREFIAQDRPTGTETTITRPEGQVLALALKASRLTDPHRGLKGHIFLFEDITAVREVEKARLRMDRYRAIVEMSAGIAHEIRNPLTSIRGCAEELAREEFPNPTARRMFGIIKEESDRLTSVITDFFNFMKESPPNKTRCVLREVVADTIEVARHAPLFKDLVFANEIDPALTAEIDRDQWKQVFLNLFLNACEAMAHHTIIRARAMPSGEVAFARKFVSPAEIAGGIEITVIDTGRGIAPESISDIFLPFYTTKSHGVGVGLSVVNRIVRNHGGTIEVQASGKSGTTFLIVLPVYKE
ncbi:MAG: ATP-binding protein [Planctomycetota bacterium]